MRKIPQGIFPFMFKVPLSAAKIFLKDNLAADGNKAKGIF